MTSKKSITIDEHLRPFAHDAVARLNYLFPDVRFEFFREKIEIQSAEPFNDEKLQHEISYALYRAKIRSEGTANRALLYAAVFGR